MPLAADSGLNNMNILINGVSYTLADSACLSDALQLLALAGKRVACELNGEIVPRSRYAETPLADGDAIELVVAVGGG